MDIKNLTEDQETALYEELKAKRNAKAKQRRQDYEFLRTSLIDSIKQRVLDTGTNVRSLYEFVVAETNAFYEIMKEYGQLRRDDQMSYKIEEKGFRIEVKTYKIKAFDERANVAASRLIAFLEQYISDSEKGTDDPIYQLAMTLLERNKSGDFDYKSISRLYQLEEQFSSTEYSEIMQLFKDSNTIEGTATNFYFYQKDEMGVWRKVEISFNRL